jgi:hypothetical protein
LIAVVNLINFWGVVLVVGKDCLNEGTVYSLSAAFHHDKNIVDGGKETAINDKFSLKQTIKERLVKSELPRQGNIPAFCFNLLKSLKILSRACQDTVSASVVPLLLILLRASKPGWKW